MIVVIMKTRNDIKRRANIAARGPEDLHLYLGFFLRLGFKLGCMQFLPPVP